MVNYQDVQLEYRKLSLQTVKLDRDQLLYVFVTPQMPCPIIPLLS